MPDPRWHLASAVEVFADLDDPDPRRLGAVVARPHPTGWFLSGHHRPDLPEAEVRHFTEFAIVRAYLLLCSGPTAETWQPGPGTDDWIAWSLLPAGLALTGSLPSPGPDLIRDLIPDSVPAHWTGPGINH